MTDRIPLAALKPPLQYQGSRQLHRLPQDTNTIMEAAGDAVALSTWWGQLGVGHRARQEAGITGPVLNRVDQDYNVFRDEDLSGMWPYLDELEDVYSHKEFLAKKYQIIINNDLRHAVEDYPVTHFFGAGLLDPINLIPVPLVLGKGFLAGARRAAAINAPLVAGTETLRVDIDPTAEPIEVLYSTMGSMLFTGLIGGLAGKYKGPIGKTTVSDALDILVPLKQPIRAETGMFNWIRFAGKGAFRRIHDRLRSTDNMGGNKSDQWTERVSVEKQSEPRIQPDPTSPGRFATKVIDDFVVKFDDEIVILAERERGSNTISIVESRLPEAMQGKGIGTAAYKALIKHAEKNKLKVVSDRAVTESAAGVWKKLEGEGFNIKRNKDAILKERTDGEKQWVDTKPIFEVLPQLIDQAKKIPKSLKQDWDEYTEASKGADKKISRIRKRLGHLRSQLDGMDNNNGGRRTKQKERIVEAEKDLQFAEGEKRIFEGQLIDTNTKMALMLDAEVAKNWDLLPTGYNKILANTDQFPFWQLM